MTQSFMHDYLLLLVVTIVKGEGRLKKIRQSIFLFNDCNFKKVENHKPLLWMNESYCKQFFATRMLHAILQIFLFF